jgi:predicted amino acid dehydrogenase
MKSQIKDIVIGIFAVIGFTAIVMGFNNPAEPQQVTYGTPESHVWEFTMRETGTAYFMYNKKTGEFRSYEIINTAAERRALKTGDGSNVVYRLAEKVD